MTINNYQINNILLNNMKKLSQNLSLNLEKLSTGHRIIRPSDAPSEILRMSKLESSIRGTQIAQRNIQEGITLLQVMNSSLSNIESISNRLYELGVGYQNGSLSSDDREVIEKEAGTLYKEIENIIENTEFNGMKVFDKDQFIIQTGSSSNDKYVISVPKFGQIKGNTTNIATFGSGLPTGYVENYEVNGYLVTGTYSPDGLLNGRTTIKDKNGNIVFDGTTKNGKFDGYAEVYKEGQLQYRGSLKNGKFDGWGELFTDGNSRYVGNFTNGKKHGEGTYIADGKSLSGKWINDSFNGELYKTSEVYTPNIPGLIPNGSGGGDPGDDSGGGDMKPPPINPPDGDNNGSGGNGNDGGDIKPPTVIPPGSGDNETDGGSNGSGSDNGNGDGGGDNGTSPPPIIPPDCGNGNGNGDDNGTDPPDNEGNKPIPPIEIPDKLNPELIKKEMLDVLNSMRSQVGIDERALEIRLTTQANSEVHNSDALANIKNVDVAKELMESVKNDMLLSTNNTLFVQNLDRHRNYILKLLK